MPTAVVSGASGNLGKAITAKLLAEGYQVIGTIHPGESHRSPEATATFTPVVLDLLDEAAVSAAVESWLKDKGSIAVAVLTVGGFAMGSIRDTAVADLKQQYQLNLETTYTLARPLFLHMLEQGSGRIFLVGSRPGLEARFSKGLVAYGLSKSLIFRLAELMNEEATGTNVVTSVIVPSTIDTPPNRKAMPDADFSKWVTPEAIAAVVAFHCSEAGSSLREPLIKAYNQS